MGRSNHIFKKRDCKNVAPTQELGNLPGDMLVDNLYNEN